MRESRRPVSMYATMGHSPAPLRHDLKRKFPSALKLHYCEMVNVAEKISRRIFARSNGSYNVSKKHKQIQTNGQAPDSWVTVHNLRQLDGGILDPDDCLLDVADDREQIIAVFDEASKPDGTSASDHSENSSPDIFKDSDHRFEPFSSNDIEITGEALNGTPPPLYVRRGSEPALNKLSPIPTAKAHHGDSNKRWSAAPMVDEPASSSTPVKHGYEDYPGERGEGSGAEKNPTSSSATSSGSSHHSATTTTLSRFSREGNRCSVQILSDNPNMARWAEAAERASGTFYHGEGQRREPLGGSSTPTPARESTPERRANETKNSVQLVVLVNDRTPLGIHVIPSTDKTGHDQGLLVEGIDPDGRVSRDGRIQIHDTIVEINGNSLRNVTFHQAQEIFKNAMRAHELRLLVAIRSQDKSIKDPNLIHNQKTVSGQTKHANITSTNKVPAASLSSRTQTAMLQSNTRRIGKRITIDLTKGHNGLGFSITTRDNPAGGEAPIYIKNILPQGAAIEDGNLRIGDRLLEVNGTEVTGYSQSEVASLLRQIAVGGKVSLTVSRQEKPAEIGIGATSNESNNQERNPDSPKLPRQLPSEKSAEDNSASPWKQKEILTFDIPVHDSERAGLGVSVKGKTSSNGPNGASTDLGIFVKNVIHGGAASKDGRLRQNDQLVNINGVSLLGKANSHSMKTLRTAMHQEGPIPGIITLTIARRLDSPKEGLGPRSGRDSVNSLGTTSSGTETLTLGGTKSGFNTPTPDQSGNSDASDNTVLFLGRREQRDMNEYGREDNSMDGMSNNPVIQRLTGGQKAASLRNESYYRATHETWNTSQLQQFMSNEHERSTVETRRDVPYGSPTVNAPSRDTVLIHDEYDVSNRYQQSHRRAQLPPPSGDEYSDQPSQSDAYVSQSSLDESAPGFSRDQFGRQSISEKRHATLDAKSTDTYQRSKKAREEREKNQDIPLDNRRNRRSDRQVGPGLGMKKSSSLESLQTMVQEMTLEEDGHRHGNGKVPRGRGCNDSFRAAVDRSYEASLPNEQMETVAEEESESSSSAFGRGNSRQSSLTSSVEDRKRGNRKNKKLLKGLGSMFRFGKHRKSPEDPPTEEEIRRENYAEAKRLHQEEHDRMQLYYQQMKENRLQNPESHHSLPPEDDINPSRSERMHQLRAEHQRRHLERKGTYPTDDMQDRFKSSSNKRLEPSPPEPKAEIQHIRAQSQDAFRKPKNRAPLQDPHQYSHYVNYEQIQMHLRKNQEQHRLTKLASQQFQDFRDKQTSREQREYQSQRSSREVSHQQRPVSNYFEYESVQAMMSHASKSGASLPRRPQPPPPNRGPPPPPSHRQPPNKAPHSRNPPHFGYTLPSRGTPTQDIYAASGYRPASQYPQPKYQRNSPHPSNAPGSKV